jgi:hypothetical protein
MASYSSSNTIMIRSGIGGAGNIHQVTPDMSATPRTAIVLKPAGAFTSGIGGAGNAHKASEHAQIARDEAVRRERAVQHATPTNYHVGIGGIGNTRTSTDTRSSSVVSSSAESYSSSSSMAQKLKSTVLDHWHKRNERISLYEAWNRKLPAYPGLFPSSADKGFATEKVYLSEKHADSQATLVSKNGNPKIVAWKTDRVHSYDI